MRIYFFDVTMFWISDSEKFLIVFFIFKTEKSEEKFLSVGTDMLLPPLNKTWTPNTSTEVPWKSRHLLSPKTQVQVAVVSKYQG